MILDKILARYAKQIYNPKYYFKILDILEFAEKINYKFTMFSDADLEYITGEINAYFNALQEPEEHLYMIKHLNSNWFVTTDKNYILFENCSLFKTLRFFIKTNIFLMCIRMRQIFRPDLIINVSKVKNDIYLKRGGISVSKQFNCNIFELDNRRVTLDA